MNQRCVDTRGSLVPYLRHELDTQKQQHIEGHVDTCGACAALLFEMRAGLSAAAEWEPTVPADKLARLNDRLTPYMHQPKRSRISFRLSVAAMATAAAALVVVGSVIALSDAEAPAPEVVPAPVASVMPAAPPAQHTAEVSKQKLSPYVRLIASADWDGRVEGAPGNQTVTMMRGYAVFSFVGGRGRKLRVSAPNALVEVVGTRFYVHSHDGQTAVGVSDGKVRVLTLNGSEVLTAGDHRTFNAEGVGTAAEPSEAMVHMDDAHLLEHHASGSKVRRRPRAERESIDTLFAQTKREAAPDPLATLEGAESLARNGAVREALALYDGCAEDTRPAFGPFRDLCRYESARLWGFTLGKVKKAQQTLRTLSQGARGEARRQATLALCELDLQSSPCAARRCLQGVVEGAGDAELRREAGRLMRRWELPQCREVP